MNKIKPQKLKKGDCIGLLSVAGNVENTKDIDLAIDYFEQKGFKVLVSKNSCDSKNYLAGSDEARKNELERFFSNPEINAIVAMRGGYGCLRIIEDIDYDIIKNNPKIFVGFSDLTVLINTICKRTGLITFHGPMAISDFARNINPNTERDFFDMLLENKTSKICAKKDFKTLYPKKASGTLFGGNLSSLATLAGTDFIPDERFILFAEDLNEPVYKLDRMFTQLLNISKFKDNLAGLALGDFLNLDNQEYFDDFANELCQKLKIPACTNFKITHNADKIILPVGVQCNFDADNGEITLTESYFN